MDDFLDQIKKLRKRIKNHYKRLDERAIWFFLATLGCWSVFVWYVQLLAGILVFYFLYTEVFRKQDMERSFRQQVKDIRLNIEASNLQDSEKEELLSKLSCLSSDLLAWRKVISINARFSVSAFFFLFLS